MSLVIIARWFQGGYVLSDPREILHLLLKAVYAGTISCIMYRKLTAPMNIYYIMYKTSTSNNSMPGVQSVSRAKWWPFPIPVSRCLVPGFLEKKHSSSDAPHVHSAWIHICMYLLCYNRVRITLLSNGMITDCVTNTTSWFEQGC